MNAINELTLADLFEAFPVGHDQRSAIVGPDGRWTRADLASDVRRFAAGLARLGVRPGQRVALLAANSGRWLVAAGAVALAGGVLVPIGTRLQSDEVDGILADSDAQLMIGDAANLGSLGGAAHGMPTVTLDDPAAEPSYASFLTDGDGESLAGPTIGEADLAALMYTAAVEGKPRGAMMTHKALVYHNLNVAALMDLSAADAYLNLLPLHHTAGLGMALAVLHAGGTNVIAAGFDPQRAAALIAEHRVSVLLTFSPMAGRILDVAREGGHDLSSVRLATGLEPLATMQAWLDAVPSMVWGGGYGQTETNGSVSFAFAPDRQALEERPVAAGYPAPGVIVRVVDEAGQQLPVGEVGEIVVRGPNVALGYWRQPAATERATRGGWWHTGDLGRFDPEGRLLYVDRKDEKLLIKTGGENVYPQEVEAALQSHPDVATCCVIGVPDSEWGEAVRAVVVAEQGTAPEADALANFCAERIARYKRPRSVLFTDALPRSEHGAVDRGEVRRQFGAPA